MSASAQNSAGTSLTLLQRLRDNEQDAWQRLLHLYRPLVRYWCTREGVFNEDAEDVIQEVFQVVATRLPSFRKEKQEDSFRGWLRGITRNHVLSHFRKSTRQPRAAGGTDAQRQMNEVSADAEATDDDPPAELNALYRRALDLVKSEFEDKTWRAFWLVAVDARKPEDVAAELGVSSAAVRKYKSRVLHRLKEELGEIIA